MTNSKREYNEFIRANLPYGITYDSARYQYVTFNGKRFVTYLEAKWYIDYLTKFGGGPEDDIRNDLFGTSEEGVWFEANDSTTLFTDVAGTTPVTTPGDAVALQLDKSQGLTLGPELVTNGTFDTDSDWAKETGWTISGGAASYSGGGGPRLSQEIALNSESLYEIKFDLTVTSGSIRFQLSESANNDSNSVVGSTLIETQSVSSFLVAGSTSAFITIRPMVPSTVVSVDNISVRELPGNHRTQATTAARPLYALHPVGGVRNRLTYTEDFSNAVWSKTELTVTGSEATPTTASSLHSLAHTVAGAGASVDTYTFFVDVEANGYDWVGLFITYDFANTTYCAFNLASGARNSPTSTGTMTAISDIIDMGGGVYRCILIATDAGFTNPYIFVQPLPASATLRTSYAGDGTSGLKIYKSQLEEGSTATNYQRVGSFLDVSEEGKARRGRLWYNGTSHFMETGTITPGTDKVQVFAGVRKLSDAAVKVFIEYSISESANPGTFVVAAPSADLDNYLFRSSGLAGSADVSFSEAAPTTNILAALGDISGDSAILRVDGVQEAISTADQGTGNYLAYPLYFGARAGTSFFFNGYEDTSIIRFGPNLDDSVISKVESYVASKTPEPTL